MAKFPHGGTFAEPSVFVTPASRQLFALNTDLAIQIRLAASATRKGGTIVAPIFVPRGELQMKKKIIWTSLKILLFIAAMVIIDEEGWANWNDHNLLLMKIIEKLNKKQ
jgi:hypothetical protein